MRNQSLLRPLRLPPAQGTAARSHLKFLRSPLLALALMTVLAVLVHGYHLGTDDAEIYIPAIKRVADPGLYPYGAEFFETHAHLSVFADLIGLSARITGMPSDWMILLWHFFSVFLLLLGCWRLAGLFFQTSPARWGGTALVAATLSVPVAGTALVLMDTYLTARSLSTPATVLAITAYLANRPKQALVWLLCTLLIHLQMGAYCAAFLACMEAGKRLEIRRLEMAAASLLPFVFDLQPARGPAREALLSRPYFLVSNWAWYEWAGIAAPLFLLWVLSRATLRGTTPALRLAARTLVPYGLLFTMAGAALTVSPRLESFARLQPMRAFDLLYVIFFVMLGGLTGEYVLQRSLLRWLAFFFPLAVLMLFLQHNSFPASPHVEWPGLHGKNPWTSAFLWVRGNTPRNAVFALDPNYMLLPGADLHGFRAIAERSALADNVKDSGAVSLFPSLADEWKKEVEAQTGLEKFRLADFANLAAQYPVTWIVTQRSSAAGLVCPYQNQQLSVCQIDPASLAARGVSVSK